MKNNFPTKAQAVIIGGGVAGCSVAYHLVKRGWKDIVLLERKQLTSGTTWHAAGLLGQLRATHSLTRLARYSSELYARLEKETGQSTGYDEVGSLSIASDEERMEELLRGASMARYFGIEVNELTPSELKKMWPLLHTGDLVGAVHIVKDAQLGPSDVTMALAKGAKMGGAQFFQNTKVNAIHFGDGKITGVATDKGNIETDVVVNCGGMWAREIGKMCGVDIPLHAAEHFYIITDKIPGIDSKLPVLRDQGLCLYFKHEAGGKLLVGFFEPEARPWGMNGIPEDFCFSELGPEWEHLEPYLENAMNRVPILRETGIQQFFNGPESFTPDDLFHLGEAPGLKGFYVAAGFNSVGILSGGGAGWALADWIVDGQPPKDVGEVDILRMLPFQANPNYLHDRTVETLGLLYQMHWPFRQYDTARNVRKSPFHGRLKDNGACFGELAGWERANWYAPTGEKAEYQYSYGRQNWFDYCGAEHQAVRENVGIFDQTSFSKLLVQGKDAESFLNRICANDIAVNPGKVVYTQWLNERGGIEADLTITRIDQNEYLIIGYSGSQVRDMAWLKSHMKPDEFVTVSDVTSGYAVLGIMGPNSRALLSSLTKDDLSNGAFPFATSRIIDLAYARVRATRITYVGELGWELYIPTEFAVGVYDAIVAAGASFDLKHAGYHAMNSLRVEKGYRHWGHDINGDDTPLEAGLGFAVAFDKDIDFIGKEALLKQKEVGLKKRLLTFTLDDLEPLIHHNETIWRNSEPVGRITSGMFAHTIGTSVGFGYVEADEPIKLDYIKTGEWEIEIASKRYKANAGLRPLYDPKNERIKS